MEPQRTQRSQRTRAAHVATVGGQVRRWSQKIATIRHALSHIMVVLMEACDIASAKQQM